MFVPRRSRASVAQARWRAGSAYFTIIAIVLWPVIAPIISSLQPTAASPAAAAYRRPSMSRDLSYLRPAEAEEQLSCLKCGLYWQIVRPMCGLQLMSARRGAVTETHYAALVLPRGGKTPSPSMFDQRMRSTYPIRGPVPWRCRHPHRLMAQLMARRRASGLRSQYLLDQQRLHLGVLGPQRIQLFRVGYLYAAEPGAPFGEGRIADTLLAAQILRSKSGLLRGQNADDLCPGEP